MAKIDTKILRELERKITTKLLTTLPLLLLTVAIPISAWHGIYQVDVDVTSWFQRSGSLMVLFAVWVEYKLFTISNLTNPISENGETYQDQAHSDALNLRYGNILKSFKYVTAVLAISGTVIWGYGDIIRGLFLC